MKKAMAVILRSYLPWYNWSTNNFGNIGVLAIIVAALCGANVLLISRSDISWYVFLYTGMLVTTAGIGTSLGAMIRVDEAKLLPLWRKRQLQAAGVILSAMLLWSLAALPFAGISPWRIVAFYLFFHSTWLWLFSLGTYGGVLQNIAMMLLVILALGDIWYQTSLMAMDWLTGQIGVLWPLYAIVFSLLSFAAFCRWYMKWKCPVANSSQPNEERVNNPFVLLLEWSDRVGLSSFPQRVSRRAKKHKGSSVQLMLLMRLSLFDRICGMSMMTVVGYIFLYLVCAGISLHMNGYKGFSTHSLLPLLCVMSMAGVATDFLRHRSSFSTLYLSARLPSRRDFAKTILRTYLLVCGSHFVVITLVVLAIHAVFPWARRVNLPQLLVTGLSLGLLTIAVTLLCSHIEKPGFLFWLIVSMLGGLAFFEGRGGVWIKVLATYSDGTVRVAVVDEGARWVLLSVLLVVAVGVFSYAVYRWYARAVDAILETSGQTLG
jgi:hypothetical protein